MRLLIDGDGCPVVDLSLRLAAEFSLKTLIFCDTAHQLERPGAETITVDKGADSADFVLVNRVSPGDIVITQDYGLAAMALSRGAVPVRQDGLVYNEDNIDGLLTVRAAAQRIRRGGGRLHGPSKRTAAEDQAFAAALRRVIEIGLGESK